MAPVNILLVDDEAANLTALEAALEVLGQNLVKARSGEEALRHLLAREFAVVLLDVRMPGMDGYETASLIRARSGTSIVPIIFLTAGDREEARLTHGYAVGAVDYLFKPLDVEVLRSKVAVFVELARTSALVREQAAELERKNRELESTNRELEAFSYSVSHDLRAPLRAIDGFSRALLESHAGSLDEEGRKYLRFVRESATQMGELIDGLLALAQVTRCELRPQRVDLSKLAREVMERLQSRTAGPERRVEFRVQEGLAADGDPRLLAVVLDNLIGNAWKFTSRRSPARVEFGHSAEGGAPSFFVRDNGAGFDMAYAGELFGAFRRLHGPQEFEGHGIGLATVQRIVRRHGGRIWAKGQPDEGATFYFTLGESPRDRRAVAGR